MTQPEVFDLTKLSKSQLAQLQKVLSAGVPSDAPVDDYSAVESVYVCHNPTQPHSFRQSAVDASEKDSQLRKGICESCGAKLGAAPVAINGNVVHYSDAAALRAGDAAALAKYAPATADDPTKGEGDVADAPAQTASVAATAPIQGGA